MSRLLTERSIEHVLLERGEVANSWRRERWDSLRLLTPNRQSRLPGYAYDGADPDGYMTMPEVVEFISGFARVCAAPVRTQTEVIAVRPADGGYRVVTNRGELRCRSLVIASGACNVAVVPAVARRRAAAIRQVTPFDTAIRAVCPKAACSSSGRPPPARSSRTRSAARGAA